MKYKIALHHSDEGYSASVPGLPGCWSQGKTEAEAFANIEVAIREYFSVAEDLLKDAEVREIELDPRLRMSRMTERGKATTLDTDQSPSLIR